MNDFDKLKDLLFGAEKETLDSISERVKRPEIRTMDVADVLPEAVHRSHEKNSNLVDSLAAPVGECLQQAFRDDPQTYGDALYPVMGPAIRKSIAHTLKEFSQQINQVVEHSLTPKGLKWRLQASRAGIPFSDFVMQKSLQYRIEQAYLISRENGLLIEHVHHAASKIKDSDAVSAMFTAIQDFVKESFSPDRTGRLESADMGEFTLWAVHGPHALLVCVIRGIPPKALRGELSAILERIHFRYGDAVRSYAGDTSSVPGINSELEKCLTFQATHDDEEKGGAPWPLIVAATLVVALLGYFWFNKWSDAKELENLTAALRSAPGIYVAEATRDGGRIVIRGLRDPLAASISEVVESQGIPAATVVTEIMPFQSLEPEIVRRRLERAVGDLDTVSFEISGSTAIVAGEAPGSWIKEAHDRLLSVTGVDDVKLGAVTDSDLQHIAAEIEALSGARFLFANGTTFATDGETSLRAFSQKLSELIARASASAHIVRVTLIGSTDNQGNPTANARLAIRRAETVAIILAEFGVATSSIQRAERDATDEAAIADMNLRNVRIQLDLIPRADRP